MTKAGSGVVTLSLGLILAGLGGCDAFGTGGPNELDEARARWRDAAVTHYSFSLRRSCFCPIESIGPVEITVANGQVVSRTFVDSGADVTDEMRWPAMEGVFEYAERALVEADEATVEFHPELGFPTQIIADWIRQAVDDEESLTIMAFARAGAS